MINHAICYVVFTILYSYLYTLDRSSYDSNTNDILLNQSIMEYIYRNFKKSKKCINASLFELTICYHLTGLKSIL